MATDRVTKSQRRAVFARAGYRCEYCLTPDDCFPGSFEVEHINPRSKGGRTVLSNLALACPSCNRHKHKKVQGIDPVNQAVVQFFNPRKQKWEEHFAWGADFSEVIGLTPTGRTTVATLQMNNPKMQKIRRLLRLAGLHLPSHQPDRAAE